MYSQNNEEQIIGDYFSSDEYEYMRSGGVSSSHTFQLGTLLTIGENDGKTLSNALGLIERGWKAVCVEPSPTAFAKLSKLHANREDVYCIQKAIGTTNGKVILHDSGTHLNQGDTSLVSTIKESEKDRWKTENFTPVEVDCVDFETLLTLSPIKKFDFITIDAEGLDIEILSQMDLKALGCKLIVVEWNGQEGALFDQLITKYGLKLIHKNAENLIYAL